MLQIDDEVVCIDDSAQDAHGDSVAKGSIYTVREVKRDDHGELVLKLRGLFAGFCGGRNGHIERSFRGSRFRKLAPCHAGSPAGAAGLAVDPAHARVMEALRHLPLAAPPAGFLPIYLPAAIVLKLRRIADAASIEGGADGFVELVIGESVSDAARSTPKALAGAADVIFNSYVFPPEVRPRIKRRLAAAAASK